MPLTESHDSSRCSLTAGIPTSAGTLHGLATVTCLHGGHGKLEMGLGGLSVASGRSRCNFRLAVESSLPDTTARFWPRYPRYPFAVHALDRHG